MTYFKVSLTALALIHLQDQHVVFWMLNSANSKQLI